MSRAISFGPESFDKPQPQSQPVSQSQRAAFTPSPQQLAVFDWVEHGSGSAFIEAVAGSGKTTTIIEAARRMKGTVAFAAFNKKIADEIKSKTEGIPSVRVGTFHSFGFAAWRSVAPGVHTEAEGKRRQMMKECCEGGVPWELQSAVSQMVSLAKQSVYGRLWGDWALHINEPDREPSPIEIEMWKEMIEHFDIVMKVEGNGGYATEDDLVRGLIGYAVAAIAWSREAGKSVIDFDDMIWLPLLENAPVAQYDWVLVDEAQDTNPARRLLASRMMKPGGRSVWVGDRAQSIYGFTGADHDAVDLILRDFQCIELPLTVTYRCSQKATRLAQSWVPQITAHPDNVEGTVVDASRGEMERLIGAGEIVPGDVILCRNTRPLVALAFELIRNGIGCHVEGRDIGKSLQTLAKKWKVTSCKALTTNLEAYRHRETERLRAREGGSGAQIAALYDRIDTLFVVMEGCDTVDQVVAKIERMFKDSQNGDSKRTVTLSTIHKAKGREWERVYILGYSRYMPSRWAKQDWEKRQEANLCYVAVTRTKRHLVLTAALED